MKKLVLILSVNLLILLILFLSFDIYCFVKDVRYNGRFYVFENPLTAFKYYARTYKRIFYTEKNYDIAFLNGVWGKYYRAPINLSSDKQPVLIMGCSFAFGNELTPEQSLMGKIAKYTSRPVYNRAMLALGADEMLYQLRTDRFYSLVPKPEWFLYVFIPDQIRRTQIPCSVVDGGVYYDKNLKIRPNINFPSFYSLKRSKEYIHNKKYLTQTLNTIKEMKNVSQKHWGNDTKYVFLFYNEDDNIYQQMKPVLEQAGFICYSLKDLTDIDLTQNEYTVSDNMHPSEKAWEIIVPELVRKTGM